MKEYIYRRPRIDMDARRLGEEIKQALGYDTRIRINPEKVWIQFEVELTEEEKAKLDILVV